MLRVGPVSSQAVRAASGPWRSWVPTVVSSISDEGPVLSEQQSLGLRPAQCPVRQTAVAGPPKVGDRNQPEAAL